MISPAVETADLETSSRTATKRTKIVCTMGPACDSRETLRQLVLAGMNVARLNFSHGSHASHLELMERIRSVSRELNTPVAILQDLCGPKIRLGGIANEPVTVSAGDSFVLTAGDIMGDGKRASVSYDSLVEEVQCGDRILIDDGLIELEVKEVSAPELICEVLAGGPLSSHKGVNFPTRQLKVPAVTEKDWSDLKFGLDNDVDFVALSFVRRDEEIYEVKEFIYSQGKDTPVIAKIEKFEALQNLEDILHAADGAMVARGDLGVETAFARVPLEQKRIIRMCRELGKPVITATQMLDSMIRNPRPTRAEVNDIANAVLDGTDAIMLSGETASGKYPLEAVKAMASIAEITEKSLAYERVVSVDLESPTAADALSLATCQMAEELKATVIIACSVSGSTARHISKFRPRAPIVAVTESDRLVRRLALTWGVTPVRVDPPEDTEDLLEKARQAALSTGLARARDLAIIQAGIPAGVKGSTNMIKLDILGHTFHRGVGVGPADSVTARVTCAATVEDAHRRLEPGDVLVVQRLDDDFQSLLPRLRGVIAAEGGVGSPAADMLEAAGVPGILGVPNATRIFANGSVVTLDVDRGLVYDA